MTPRKQDFRVILGAVAAVFIMALVGCGSSAEFHTHQHTSLDVSSIAGGQYIYDVGDTTLGPVFTDNQWQLMLTEADSSTLSSGTWRRPESTAIEVNSDAEMRVPDSQHYDFLLAAPGDHVWVIPEATSNPTPTLSISAIAPEAMSSLDNGLAVALTGVQGPGTLHVYTQTGGRFGEPEPLWNSRDSMPQSHWLDLGGETPLNWVFTDPGIYLVQVTARADLKDGSEFSDTQQLRFAVGDSTGEQALEESWRGPSTDSYFRAEQRVNDEQGTTWTTRVLWASTVLFALLFLAVVITAASRSRRRRYDLQSTTSRDAQR
ncbi:choice-of-anchor M domain-containing protein [Nesterenkonia haasae]|uniref:choice-of-anchor M domain-containing protein n=1 Tax=Nesterenkonia haasae TaxID=2587813 RepID=UPI001391E691|nr:choice-of-anchor M domain-containing protein [Nesterenkonia haasae]NDK31440.1 hypothetical protein [Nesterenkonia haasae]